METEFFRNCPKCGDVVYHISMCNMVKMVKKNSSCKKCRGISQRKNKSEILSRSCPRCESLISYSTRKNMNQGEKRKSLCIECSLANRPKITEETKKKISRANAGKNNGMYGKTHTDEYKNRLAKLIKENPLPITKEGVEKMRISLRKKYAENFLLRGFKCPRVNPKSCEFIDVWGKENGYSFQHGLNGGEVYFSDVGAFVDGYDKSKNVVFEYDEKHHFDRFGNLKKKDLNRMADLMKKVGCKVVRYNESTNKIEEYKND